MAKGVQIEPLHSISTHNKDIHGHSTRLILSVNVLCLGEEAAKPDNLFFYHTHEGAVDMDNVHDPVKKAAYLSQIME